jgi:predicted AlkP superfamily phosphohydrolase/phosphomutase
LREDLLRGVRGKAGISRMMLERGPYDLFLTVFAEPHWAMHLFWDTLDPDHPKHDPQRADIYASTFTDVLAEIDQFIGDARQRHPEADLLVFSLSGMGPNYSGWHLLPEVLKRLAMGPPDSGAASMSPLRRWGPHALRRLDSLVPTSWIERVKQAVPERLWDRATRGLLYRGAGWAQSKAFWLPNDYSGAIRINLAGREPMGKVSPGREYEAVCDEIETALLDLVEVDTGRPAVRRVIRTRQAFEGTYRDDLPDLIVLWADSMPLEKVQSERLGRIELPSPERRSGGHRNQGFLVAAGPSLPAAGMLSQKVSVVDLAPTILDLLQVERPVTLKGSTLRRLVAGVAA